jgi:NADPH:quinone reductase-like Zn-dependent oxidoreductase
LKAVRIHARGDQNGLVYEDTPPPYAATGDVLVKVQAASFVTDELSWSGTWVDRAGRDRTPSIPAHEVAGVVEELSYGTSGLAVGDRVFGLTDWHRDGAAFVAVEARNLTAMPRSLDFRSGCRSPA